MIAVADTAIDGGGMKADGRRTILVAEDEPSVRDLILTTLRRNGFSALSAADGREAMQLIEVAGRRIDLVVSDVVMPGIDGVELAKLARATRPSLPIILMSGYGQWQLPPDSGLGDVHRLEKPFTARQLTSAIQVALGRS
jgi:two-component system cell cycle sensor histidine kinase/response regulator CckA